MPVTKSRACKRCFPCPRNRWPVGCGPVFQLSEPSNRTNEAGLSTNTRLECYWDQGFSAKSTLATVTHVLQQEHHVSSRIPNIRRAITLHVVTENLNSRSCASLDHSCYRMRSLRVTCHRHRSLHQQFTVSSGILLTNLPAIIDCKQYLSREQGWLRGI